MRKVFFKIVSFVCVVIFLNGCIEKNTQTQSTNIASIRNYPIYDIGIIPHDLKMMDMKVQNNVNYLIPLFEGLVDKDENGKIVPGIAESWNLSDDQTCLTFKIRADARFSDGSDITANNFVDFFKNVLSEKDSLYSNQLYYICGAEKYRNGKLKFDSVGIKAQDSKTLQINLEIPCTYFLNILSEGAFRLRIFDDNIINFKSNYTKIKYCGAYTIKKVDSNGDITLEKNEYYWNKNTVKSSCIMLVNKDSSEENLVNFNCNKIDLFTDIPSSQWSNLDESENIFKKDLSNIYGLAFNMKKQNITSDISLRKAISASIDRKELASLALKGNYVYADTYIPHNVNNSLNGVYQNKLYFNQLNLEEIKYYSSKIIPQNKDVKFKLIYISTVENKKISDKISKDINEKSGIDVQSYGCTFDEFEKAILSGNYDMAQINITALYDAPESLLEIWTTNTDFNKFGYNDDTFNETIKEIKLEKNLVKRNETVKKAEDMLMQELPFIPIFNCSSDICISNNIKGVYVDKNGEITINNSYLINPIKN